MALAKQGTNVERRDAHAKGIAQAERFPIVSMVLLALTFVGMMISIWMIFLYAPTDAIEGDAQRIFYFHLPTAIIGMLAFGIVTIGGIMYLWKKEERWDWAARAAAELGAVFLTFALITGSIWGRTTWGTWWTWDSRLTTTLILWFIADHLRVGQLVAHTASPAGATHWLVAAAAAGDAVHVVGFVCYLDVALQLPDGATLSTGEDANTRPALARQRRIKAKDEVPRKPSLQLRSLVALLLSVSRDERK